MWELESAAPPADQEARKIQVTLAQSRARYVSADLEFAVWTATIGEGREGEPVTVERKEADFAIVSCGLVRSLTGLPVETVKWQWGCRS